MTMRNAMIAREGNAIRVRGDLSFETTEEVLLASQPILDALSCWEIELSEVRHADSAGLALLMTWFRQAKQQQKSVHFYGIPVQMQKLIDVSGLNSILPIQKEPSSSIGKI